MTGYLSIPGHNLELGCVEIYENDEAVGTIDNLISNQNFTFEYTPESIGNKRVYAKFLPNELFFMGSDSNVISFGVYRSRTLLGINGPEEKYVVQQPINIRGTFIYPHTADMSGHALDVYINDEKVATELTDKRGKINYVFTPTILGNYNVRLGYAGDPDGRYAPNMTNAESFTVVSDTAITLDLDWDYVLSKPIEISGRIFNNDSYGFGVFPIDVYVDDEKVSTAYSSADGRFTCDYMPTSVGYHTIRAEYGGNDEYLPSVSDNYTVYVFEEDGLHYMASVILDMDERVRISPELNIKGHISVPDYTGSGTFPVNIYVNDELVDRVFTDGNREFECEYNFTEGNYTIRAEYEGADDIASNTTNKTIRAFYAIIITLDEIPSEVILYGELPVTGHLSVDGKTNLSEDTFSVYVRYYVDDVVQAFLPVNMDGTFNYTIKVLTVGEHTTKVALEGYDDYLDATSNTLTFDTIVNTTIETDIEDEYLSPDRLTIKAGIYPHHQDLDLSGLPIDIYINDVYYGQELTDNLGEITYTIYPNAGNNTIRLEFAGKHPLLPCSYNKTFAVIYNTSITLDDFNGSYTHHDPVSVTGKITAGNSDNAGFPIKIILNNNLMVGTYIGTAYSGENGYFTLTFPDTEIFFGNYTVRAEFEGSDGYLPSVSNTQSFFVLIYTEMVIEASVNDDAQVNIVLSDLITEVGSLTNATLNVSCYVNGEMVGQTVFHKIPGEYNYTLPGPGTYEICMKHGGNFAFEPTTSNIVTVVYKYSTDLTLDELADEYVTGSPIALKGRLTDRNSSDLFGYPIDIYVNDQFVDREFTNESGMFNYLFTPTEVGEYTVKAEYEGNSIYFHNISNVQTFNVSYNTSITLEEMEDCAVSTPVSISGMITSSEEISVGAFPIDIYVNDEKVDRVYTDNYGRFSSVFTPEELGNYTIYAKYTGGDNYYPSTSNNVILAVKPGTTLELTPQRGVKYGDTISIAGNLIDVDLNTVVGTVKLKINNGSATVKTNSDGVFVYEYTVTRTGTINVTANYLGSKRYLASADSIVFDVSKADSLVILDDIAPVKRGAPFTVSGRLTDCYGNGFYGTVKLLINNGRATVKTDNDGYFAYNDTLSSVGEYNISAWYLGSAKYEASENATITVSVEQLDTRIVLDEIVSVKVGDNVTISGKLLDENGDAMTGTVKLLINGGRATVKTDANGVFAYSYRVTKAGINNITASFVETNNYDDCNVSATFNVSKLGTMIKLDAIETVVCNSNVTIGGRLCDEMGNGIYGTVKLLINNGRATVKTDADGFFTYTYCAARLGTNNITADYLESNSYSESQSKATFDVIKA